MEHVSKSKPAVYPALFLGVLALSTSAIFVRLAQAPSSITAFYRLLFSTLALLPFLLFNRNNRQSLRTLTRRQGLLIFMAGLFLAIHYVMWFESLNYTSVASSTVLVTLQPLFSIVWGVLFLKERYSRRAVTGCLVAIVGSAVIGWGDFQISWQALLGDLLSVTAAGVVSVYFLIGQIVRKDLPVIPYSVLGYLSSSFFLFIYACAKHEAFSGYPGASWAAFLGLALISTICGQFVFNLLLKWVSATMVSMSILGESIGACFLAWLILHESVSLRQGVGIIIILAGLSLYFFPVEKSKTSQ